jgi:DNA-binding NtrC family response regulator
VLVVDDDLAVRTLISVVLQERGIKVWTAPDGDKALNAYRWHRAEIDLVLLDVQMPGLDGPHTLFALRQFAPDIVACFMTGDPGIHSEAELTELGAVHIFRKPFRMAEMGEVVQQIIGQADSPATTSRAQRNWRTIHGLSNAHRPF